MTINLPSINVPFTDTQGRITPIWHEFLRSFVAGSVAGTIVTPEVASEVVAGNGLVGGGPISSDVPLRVGQGSGIAVNADDVNVDINGTTYRPGTLDDEILISSPADNNQIRKTRLRDVAGLSSPGGLDTYVQYNNGGVFAGNSGFTYNGSNGYTLGALTVTDGTFVTSSNATKFSFQVPGGTASDHFVFRQVVSSGSSDMPVRFGSTAASTEIIIDNGLDNSATTTESRLRFAAHGTTKWTMGLEGSSSGSKFVMGVTAFNVGTIYNIDPTNFNFNMVTSLTRSTTATITAATTQTQGQRPLTTDVNEISVCANANDVVTLPIALAGRSCLVINNGAQTLQVFPASGDDLGAGVNISTTIVATSRKLFVAFDSTNWEPVI